LANDGVPTKRREHCEFGRDALLRVWRGEGNDAQVQRLRESILKSIDCTIGPNGADERTRWEAIRDRLPLYSAVVPLPPATLFVAGAVVLRRQRRRPWPPSNASRDGCQLLADFVAEVGCRYRRTVIPSF
jgi:hypothetical protein